MLFKEFDKFIQMADNFHAGYQCFSFLQHKHNFSFADKANTFHGKIYLNCDWIIHIRGVCKIKFVVC